MNEAERSVFTDMEYPEHSNDSNHVSNHVHVHVDVNKMDEPSPMKMRLILALLTFLLAVICVLSIRMISKEVDTPPDLPNDSITPGESDDPVDPGNPQSPTDPTTPTTPTDPADPSDEPDEPEDPAVKDSFLMKKTSQIKVLPKALSASVQNGIYSENAIFVDLSNNTIIAGRNEDQIIFPASMTKVMTLLVACENLKDSDYGQYVTMSKDIIEEMQRQNASGFGFRANEEITVRDLLYAVALESDCAASIQLARYIAGSHEAFVQMMNDKCKELGLVTTHFTNATGLHDNNHYSTCREMATIMAAAVANDDVLALMATRQYESKTNIHSRITFYNTYFVDMASAINTYSLPDGVRVVAAKTGHTDEGGYCLVTYLESSQGKPYVIITANASVGSVRCADYDFIYTNYAR